MTVLDEFYASYLHYTVAQRLFEDTCRQLLTFKGDVDERQAMVDETLRLSMCVTDNIDETEGLMADTIEYLQSEEGGSDVLEALSLIANNLKEDRARANSYSNYITYRRIGNRTRKPRRPQVANPFTYVVEDEEPVEMVVIPPTDAEADPEPIPADEPVECEDAPVTMDTPSEEEDEGPAEEALSDEIPEEEPVSEEIPEDDSDGDGGNPLAEETERILRGENNDAEQRERSCWNP